MANYQVIPGIAGIFLLVGAVFAVVALILGRSLAKKKHVCSAQTIGKITDYRRIEHTDSDGNAVLFYHAVFSYYANGRDYSSQSSFGRTRPKFPVGQSILIRYDPANPETYYVPKENYGGLVKIFGFVSALLIVLAAVLFGVFLKFSLNL